jgi:DNA-binding beta-propeller fold protein YncE
VSLEAILLLFSGCKNNPVWSPPTLDGGQALYVSLDGGNNNAGLWIIDPNSLELIDSLGTGQGVPSTLEFSPDYRTWYSSWTEYPSRQSYLFAVDNTTISIVQRVPVGIAPIYFTLKKDKDILIGYSSPYLKFYDRSTLSLFREDTSHATVWHLKPSITQSKLYLTEADETMFTGLTIFSLDSFAVEKVIPVADTSRQKVMEPADLAISTDDKYAFLSVFNWHGLGGYNSLFVVDLAQSKVIGEYTTGAFAQLCLSPDGRYVYISDPAGYKYMMSYSNEILRYDIATHSMEVFTRLNELGLSGSVFTTDKIVIASDNRTMFISVSGDVKNPVGGILQILKMDASTRKVLNSFSLPLDSLGRITQMITNLKIAVHSK